MQLICSNRYKRIPLSAPSVRVRFAPSPTGIMHIGNIRTALLNYLFAKQKNGTFVVRIEDTDPQRNFDPGAKIILSDLSWLDLSFQEGPGVGGPYEPYFQSERLALYQKALEKLKEKGLVYQCFCSQEELDKKRERQRALKVPPRYDRTCMRLSQEEIEKELMQNRPFIWRFKINHNETIQIQDLARGTITFTMKHFSDFPLTRADGSFTFMFANFVDDMLMKMSYVFRGEDHQSNTAGQAALYQAFDAPLPTFWHMPMLCNIEGKKLSKRDFGFSLHDLKKAGYLPEAIINYLSIIGTSFKQEIMPLEKLAQAFNFEHVHAGGGIKYDVEKLRWVNHQWICKLEPMELAQRVQPFLIEAYPETQNVSLNQLSSILQIIKTDLYTLKDAVEALKFYFVAPEVLQSETDACVSPDNQTLLFEIIKDHLDAIGDVDAFVQSIKQEAKNKNIPLKNLFWIMRLSLTGQINGPSIHDLITILGPEESKKRIKKVI